MAVTASSDPAAIVAFARAVDERLGVPLTPAEATTLRVLHLLALLALGRPEEGASVWRSFPDESKGDAQLVTAWSCVSSVLDRDLGRALAELESAAWGDAAPLAATCTTALRRHQLGVIAKSYSRISAGALAAQVSLPEAAAVDCEWRCRLPVCGSDG